MLRHLPNTLTLANLFCGCCALLYVLHGQPQVAALFTVASFLFDYADGMVARALRISSPLGKELDSLADVISFGVVPGAMLYMMLSRAACLQEEFGFPLTMHVVEQICPAAFLAFILSAMSALRLGKFNLDTRQANYFIGLSTPACTVFVLGLSLASARNLFGINSVLLQPWLLRFLIAALSVLLVSEIPMFGMKIKSRSLKANAINLAFLLLFILLIFLLKELALSAIILIYIFTSILFKDKVTAA